MTGRLTGLTGELQSNFSLTLGVDFSVDELTSKSLKLDGLVHNENDGFYRC